MSVEFDELKKEFFIFGGKVGNDATNEYDNIIEYLYN